eukprot:m.98578 g.98578  ORF g.98578 m.98578 type:complete len:64 (-) comp20578_c0_seq1:322-513(-)
MATCSGFISCTSTAYSGFISRSNTPTAYSKGVLYDHHEQDLGGNAASQVSECDIFCSKIAADS